MANVDDFQARGQADGEERAGVIGAYVLAHPGLVDIRAFYKDNVTRWFEAKEQALRSAGASDTEIIEYLKAANTSMNAMLDDASRFVVNRAGNRHERRRASARSPLAGQ
jgi:hypothetical protein